MRLSRHFVLPRTASLWRALLLAVAVMAETATAQHASNVPTGAASRPQTQPDVQPAATSPDPENLAAQRQRQLQVFGPVLLNPSSDIDAGTRRSAAAELLDMNSPEALEVLSEALRSRRPAVALAALAAMQRAATLPERLLDPCVQALETASAEVMPALAIVLARYDETAASRIAEIALRAGATPAARLNAVNALGFCRSRQAAAALMRTLETAPAAASAPFFDPAAAELLRASTASLERMTGLSHGNDLNAWRAWWSRVASESDEQWFRLVSESLAHRVATLQQQLQEQRQATERTSRELFSTYRDLFPALPIGEQLKRLELLLEDRLPPLREFGLNRVGVLARDSVRIPGNVVDLVRARLSDEVPELRLAAAELLDELGDERASEAIAARLTTETSPQVIAGMLNLLARRPTQASLAPTLRLLGNDASADHAADALWQILQSPLGTAANLAEVREPARVAARRLTPATLRLAALVGDERDTADLTVLLDDDNPARRAAVAEGFFRRGLRQPLLDRSGDEAIYPFVIRAIADGPADLPAFTMLAGLEPPEAHRRLWGEMVLKMASRLPADDLLIIDEVLRSIAYADVALRRDLMAQAVARPRDAISSETRTRIVERLAPMLIDLGEAARAHELLESLNGNTASPTLRVPRFQAAALTGHYDLAAQIQPDPAQWVSLLAREFERGNPATVRLHDEIARRFGEQLTPADAQRLQEIGLALETGDGQRG
jgi:hypothetical protein